MVITCNFVNFYDQLTLDRKIKYGKIDTIKDLIVSKGVSPDCLVTKITVGRYK